MLPFIIEGVGLKGILEMTLHSTMACTGIHLPPCFGGYSEIHCTPEILASSRCRFRPSHCTKHLVMSAVDNVESSNALVCVVNPSGPISIWTLHVISRTFLCCMVHDTLGVTTSDNFPECKTRLRCLMILVLCINVQPRMVWLVTLLVSLTRQTLLDKMSAA